MATETTTQGAANTADFGFGSALSGIFNLGLQYGQSYIESVFEPAPTTVTPAQAGGATTAVPVTPQGEQLSNANAAQMLKSNPYVMYAIYGVLSLLVLLIILKLIGLI